MIPSSNINFDEVMGKGNTLSNDYYKLFYLFKTKGDCRLGVSIPKTKVPHAHKRNRLRRVIRNAMTSLRNHNIDIVIILKKNLHQYSKNDDIIVRELILKDTTTILDNR